MKKVTKAVIPAAGFGTRFLPQTKAMPKEMLPVVDKPIIQYVVEEAVSSGIEDIIIITGSNKRAVEDHFDRSHELERMLENAGKNKQRDQIKEIANLANFIYVRQKGSYGTASSVMDAKHLVDGEPFAVLWGDEFIYSKPPRLKQLIEVFNKYQKPVISGVRIKERKDLAKYGIAKIKEVDQGIYKMLDMVEKPDPNQAPSNLAAHGAFIFTPQIFKYIENLKPGKSGELWLTDAIHDMIQEETVYAAEIENGTYYDTGDKLGYLKTVIDFSLGHKEFGKDVREYMEEKVKQAKS